MEVIQQWQYNGIVHTDMLKDDAFRLAKEIGITALQSYVPWSNVEPQPGSFDFSLYDPLVEKIQKHGLGWVPFLILSPYYATPEWFLKSEERVFFKCLEHNYECKIQSLWNPYLKKYLEGFIRAFYEHYHRIPAIKSILLGISGNWGESIYPVSGGFVKEKHMHPGWWCGDKYAIKHFRNTLRMKYKDIRALNEAWEKGYIDFESTYFPNLSNEFAFKHNIQQIGYKFLGWLPKNVKSFLKSIMVRPETDIELKGDLIHWLDFVKWYVFSMTEWMEFWLSTIRKYFKDKPIYVVTGGHGSPMLGADFFKQIKAAARYSAGIRVTNLSDSYPESSVLSKLVSSPCRFYGSYFETEEAHIHSPKAITMRIFDAVTSGARGVYFKTLLGPGKNLYMGNSQPPGEPTNCAKILKNNMTFLHEERPTVEAALFYPNTAVILDPNVLLSFKRESSALRDYFDLDFLDEGMVSDGAIKTYRFFILINYCLLRFRLEEIIMDWVKNDGGILIQSNKKDKGLRQMGKGYILSLHKKKNYIRLISKALHNLDGVYPWKGLKTQDGKSDGLYVSGCENGIYFFNSTGNKKIINLNGKKSVIEPNSLLKEEHV